MNCNGCKSLRCYGRCYGGFECVHTRVGIKDLITCPCKECLLKTVCQDVCPEFRNVMLANRDIMYF